MNLPGPVMILERGFREDFQKKCRHYNSRSIGECKRENRDNKNEASNDYKLWYIIIHFLALDSIKRLFAIIFKLCYFNKQNLFHCLIKIINIIPFWIPYRIWADINPNNYNKLPRLFLISSFVWCPPVIFMYDCISVSGWYVNYYSYSTPILTPWFQHNRPLLSDALNTIWPLIIPLKSCTWKLPAEIN